MPLESSFLRQPHPVQFPDATEVLKQFLSLRQLADQRRYREQQYRAQELLARQREQEFQEGQNLRQLFAGGKQPTEQEIIAAAPFKGIPLVREQRQAETAALQQRQEFAKIQQGIRERLYNGLAAVAATKDPAKRSALYKQVQADTIEFAGPYMTPDLARMLSEPEPDDASIVTSHYRIFGPEKTEEMLRKRETETRAQAEEVRKAEKHEQDVQRFGPQLAKDKAEAEKAQNELLGLSPPTGTIKEFTELFEPGYYASKGITKPTAQDRMQAYSSFQEMRRPRIEVPGVDVPLTASVAQQRVQMETDVAAARAKAAATDKPLSAEAAKVKSVADSLIPEARQLKEAIRSGGRLALTGILTGTDPNLSRLADNIADKVGRLRSGGAINRDEGARFMGQLARWVDVATGDTKAAEDAIDRLIEEAQGVSGSMGGKPPATAPKAPEPTSAIPKVGEIFNGQKVLKVTKVK